jgi:hypothetical protein
MPCSFLETYGQGTFERFCCVHEGRGTLLEEVHPAYLCQPAGGVARLAALLCSTARLGVTLCSDIRFATAGTGGERALPDEPPPKEASSCSKIFGFRPAGSSFLTALPTLECTCNRIPGMR